MQPLKYVSWHQNANVELMTAILFVSAPKGTYKDNEYSGTSAKCLYVDNDGFVCKMELREYYLIAIAT